MYNNSLFLYCLVRRASYLQFQILSLKYVSNTGDRNELMTEHKTGKSVKGAIPSQLVGSKMAGKIFLKNAVGARKYFRRARYKPAVSDFETDRYF